MSDHMSGGIRIERSDLGSVVVVLTGEHDVTTKGAVETCLGSAIEGNDLVVADLSEALFIDSSTMHVLVLIDRAARQRNRTFRLQLQAATAVERALELAGLLRQIDHAPTREEALNGRLEPSPQPA